MPQTSVGRTKVTTQMGSRPFVTGWQDVMFNRGWRDDFDTCPRAQGRYERGRQFAVWALVQKGDSVRVKTFKQGNTVPASVASAFLRAVKEGVL